MKRKFIVLFITSLFLFTFPAFAEDNSPEKDSVEEGYIESDKDLPSNSEIKKEAERLRNEITKLSLNNSDFINANSLREGFDTQKKMNKFKFLNERTFYTNVLPDMTTTRDINFIFGDNVRFSVIKDDEYFPYQNGDLLIESGFYKVYVFSNFLTELGPKNTFTEINFRIIKNKVNNFGIFNAPEFCEISSIYHEPKEGSAKTLLPEDSRSFHLISDGKYRIELKDKKTGILYTDTFFLDNTPPSLKITGINDQNISTKSVTIESKEQETNVIVLLGGSKIYEKTGQYSQTFVDTGNYTVYLKDLAGNTSQYNFTIQYGLHLGFKQIFGFLFAIALLLSVAAVHLTRRVRVR